MQFHISATGDGTEKSVLVVTTKMTDINSATYAGIVLDKPLNAGDSLDVPVVAGQYLTITVYIDTAPAP